MSDKDKRNIFNHEGFDYVGVRMPELHTKATWLPYFERLALVVWLYVVCTVLQNQLDMPADRLGRLLIASLWVVVTLWGMGYALKRAGNRIAVSYQERVYRRRITFALGTIGAIIWIVAVHVLLNMAY